MGRKNTTDAAPEQPQGAAPEQPQGAAPEQAEQEANPAPKQSQDAAPVEPQDAAPKEPEIVRFRSTYPRLKVQIEPGRYVRFEAGAYETADETEIAILRSAAGVTEG